MTRIFLTFLATAMLLPLTMTPANAQALNDAQKEEVKKLFDEYLQNSGQAILESVNKYQAELAEKDRQEASAKAKTFMDELLKNNDLPMAGNPEGDVTVVEFFDYNCGYCHKALVAIQDLLKDDKNVKVIFMDMPILGPNSLEAAKWALASYKQGKYFEYHQALMGHSGQKDEGVFKKLAKEVGLDVKQLEKDKADSTIEKTLQDHIAQAGEIGIRGTPGFIVGEELSPGFMPVERMKEIIAEQRKK